MMTKQKGYTGNLRRFETTPPPILNILFEKYTILNYGHKWILKGWNNIYIYVNYELFSACTTTG